MSIQDSANETVSCRWDPDNPASCFDDESCGCYMDPCDFFEVSDEDCMPFDENEWCCTMVETCCELER